MEEDVQNRQLTLRMGQRIHLACGATVILHGIKGNQVRLLFDAPMSVTIVRAEAVGRNRVAKDRKTEALGQKGEEEVGGHPRSDSPGV